MYENLHGHLDIWTHGHMDTASFESLARDYWDAVETGKRQPLVEYGSDLDTLQYCSGFSKKLPHTSGIEGKEYISEKANNLKGDNGKNMEEHSSNSQSGTGMFSNAYYERTGWNLNNLASTEGSVLKYLQVSIPFPILAVSSLLLFIQLFHFLFYHFFYFFLFFLFFLFGTFDYPQFLLFLIFFMYFYFFFPFTFLNFFLDANKRCECSMAVCGNVIYFFLLA